MVKQPHVAGTLDRETQVSYGKLKGPEHHVP